MKNNIFQEATANKVIQRIENLTQDSKAIWGKMTVSQMLAHCNVTYEMAYEHTHPKPNFVMKFVLKMFVKDAVVSDKPYPKNGKTAPQFIIEDEKDFNVEKKRLTDYIKKTQALGEAHFDGKESHSFGHLNKEEWNNMFHKHLDHHLRQFGV